MNCLFSPSSSNPIQFDDFLVRSPLRREPIEKMPAMQFADPDIFITFESSNHEQDNQRDDLESPRSDDSLEKIIKKIKLDHDYIKVLPQEYNKALHSQEPSRRCPMMDFYTSEEQYSSFKSCIYKQTLSQMNFHNQERGFAASPQEKNDDVIVVDEEDNENNCEEDDAHETQDSSTQGDPQNMKVNKGAKTIYQARMVDDHEKLLWESFAKVHSHIPNFPMKEKKHFDYVAQVLKRQASNLFQIASQHQQEYLQSKGNKKGETDTTTEKPVETQSIQDPRLVFENEKDKELLSKCPVMSNLFQDDDKEKPQVNMTQPIPPAQNTGLSFGFQMPSFNMFGNYQNMNQYNFDPFGSLQCHRYQFNQMFAAGGGRCPFNGNGLGTGKVKAQAPSRERRSAFNKAVQKMKGKKLNKKKKTFQERIFCGS